MNFCWLHKFRKGNEIEGSGEGYEERRRKLKGLMRKRKCGEDEYRGKEKGEGRVRGKGMVRGKG